MLDSSGVIVYTVFVDAMSSSGVETVSHSKTPKDLFFLRSVVSLSFAEFPQTQTAERTGLFITRKDRYLIWNHWNIYKKYLMNTEAKHI